MRTKFTALALGLMVAGGAHADEPTAVGNGPAGIGNRAGNGVVNGGANGTANAPANAVVNGVPDGVGNGTTNGDANLPGKVNNGTELPPNPLNTTMNPNEPSPFLIGIYQGVTSDSNLFRAPSGSGLVVHDTISSTGIRLGVNLPVGRQRFTADVEADANRYRHNSQLNNTDYKLTTRLDWQTVERVSGEITADAQQSPYRDTASGVITTQKSLLRTADAGFQIRVGLVTLWSFEGGFSGSQSTYSNNQLSNRDVRQGSVNAGVRWRPSDVLSGRVGLRHTEGSYPHYGVDPDEFKRDDLDLNGDITITGVSSVNARLSATREHHSVQGQRDANGWTGALGWKWQPTGKLTFDVGLSRDSSVGSANFDSSLVNAQSSDARTSESATLAVTWAATAKIQVLAHANYAHRKLDNAFDTATAGTMLVATDRTTAVGLGLRYQPLRAVDLGCDVAREQRNVDGNAALSTPYSVNTLNCSVQLSLR